MLLLFKPFVFGELNWGTFIVLYILIAIGVFMCCMMIQGLESDEDYLPFSKITSLTIFWPIYFCLKLPGWIVIFSKFMWNVLKTFISDIFKR